MQYLDLKCNNCNASLKISSDRKECFCEYCGNKIIIDDGSYTVTHKVVNESIEKELELAKLLAQEKDNDLKLKMRKNIIGVVAWLIAIISIFINFYFVKNDFNMSFNLFLMIIGYGIGVIRIICKRPTYICSLIVSIVTLVVSLAFLMVNKDFNTSFSLLLVVIIVSNVAARFVQKYDKNIDN